jgi:NAD(P)-dependent dehydrogenase (short-subunit alcohol dehydrogenase family)
MTTSLVTGANRGIGLELCRALRAEGHDVIGVCRSSSPELEALGARVEKGVDLTSDADVAALAARLAGVHLDWLVLNAGILEAGGLDSIDFESLKKQYDVNALGPLRVVKALHKNLSKGSKIGVVTSRVGSLGDNGSGGMYGYRMSKAAANMASVSLARDLAPEGIAVMALHPGFIRTRMTGGGGNADPDEAARGLVARMKELTLATTADFRHANGEKLPW